MMRFKEYLKEVVRDTNRAMSLLRKYGDRYPLHPDPDMRSHDIKNYGRAMRTPFKDYTEAPGAHEDAYVEKMIGAGADRETKPMKVPVKHLYHFQGEVDRHYVLGGMMTQKHDEGKPIRVMYHRDEQGNHGYTILDGHHRATEARFRGDTHIMAHVAHSSDMPPPGAPKK